LFLSEERLICQNLFPREFELLTKNYEIITYPAEKAYILFGKSAGIAIPNKRKIL
jgi:hypothetical protein